MTPQSGYGQGNRRSSRIGLIVSVLVHVLALVYYLTRDDSFKRAPPPAEGSRMVYITPMAAAPKLKTPPRQEVALAKPTPPPKKQALASIAPPSITPAVRRLKQEVFVPPVVAPLAPPVAQAQDMEAQIAAARQRRAQAQPPAEHEESADERGQRLAKANIAGAQGHTSGADRNDGGGVFSILNQNYHSAEVKFRGWNGNFKRNWTQQVLVEQGAELDIETAIVKKMIELIRKEKVGDFVWDSHRLGRLVNLSARVEDTAELQAFLLKEFFPTYQPHAR